MSSEGQGYGASRFVVQHHRSTHQVSLFLSRALFGFPKPYSIARVIVEVCTLADRLVVLRGVPDIGFSSLLRLPTI